ncbi:glycosyltransferase family 4 protein [Lutibacter sp.]|uniref:glycosyltransferase family 4 protein n=1 Tax=Lutibacter sp. TaxID=1925666 RepID=UPI0025C7274C|nr:glycosyltransferase family 4 protein [Lutibacter sp.]
MCWGVLKNYKASYILIDTYSTNNFYYAFIISQLARVFQIKYIPILHGGNLPQRLQKNPFLAACIFKNSVINVSPSHYLLEVFSKAGFPTMVIPNAIAIDAYAVTERTTFAPKVLWVRAFDKIYNPTMAVAVLVELKKSFPNATLCMVGPDKDGSLQEVMEFAKFKNVAAAIEFTGGLSKEDWIQKSKNYDIFINTSNFDNMPVSVIEAMALGLPVISTNVGGISYLIADGNTGKLVAKNNAVEMAEVIRSILENPLEGLNIAKNARKQVELFDEREVLKMWLKVVQK